MSSVVNKVSVALPVVGTITVRSPATTPQAPAAATLTVTSSAAAGAGLAVSVKTASPPSVTGDVPAAIETADSSSSRTATVAEAGEPAV